MKEGFHQIKKIAELFVDRRTTVHVYISCIFSSVGYFCECVFLSLQRPTLPSSCPPAFADLMRKCWEHDPKVLYMYMYI